LCVGQTGNPVRVSRAVPVLGIHRAWLSRAWRRGG
jgi:hypothetical protein